MVCTPAHLPIRGGPPPHHPLHAVCVYRYASTGSGWTALSDVDNPTRKRDDKMESFVLAETVKYFYLLFDPDYPIPLDKYVFNTEAHPLGHIEVMDTGR